MRTKIYKHMDAVLKIVYVDKWDEIVKKFNKIYQTTIKMKPADTELGTSIYYSVDPNDKNLKFKGRDYVRISK